MPFRFYRRKSLDNGLWVGLSKSGLTVGQRGTRVSASVGSHGARATLRLAKGLSYVFRPKR